MKVKEQARWIPSEEELLKKVRLLSYNELIYLLKLLEYVRTNKARCKQIWSYWRREYIKAGKAIL